MTNYLPPIIVVLIIAALCIYFISTSSGWFVPIIKTTVSTDGGKTFTNTDNEKTIPVNKNIYVKYEISVKTRGFGRLFSGTRVGFNLEFPKVFKLYDFTGIKKATKENKYVENERFSAVASGEPKKTEITLLLKAENNTAITPSDFPHELTVEFKYLFRTPYKKVIKLPTISSEEEAINVIFSYSPAFFIIPFQRRKWQKRLRSKRRKTKYIEGT